jgi:hypothetical protein
MKPEITGCDRKLAMKPSQHAHGQQDHARQEGEDGRRRGVFDRPRDAELADRSGGHQ